MTVPPPASPVVQADRIFFRWIFPLLLFGIFALYATYRQRYIGATDWYGYYQQGELLKSGRVFLPTEFPAVQYPAIVPYGYVLMGSHVVPQYTPGFPLLLAAGSFLGLAFFVTPLVGLVSCLLMFALIRDFTDRRVAAVFTLAWAFFPIVVYGSTTLMSDLVAATALLGAYYAYRRGQLLLSAWILGYGFCVRPTNVLFLAVFLVPLARDRRLIRYALYLVVPVLLYAWYNLEIYGSPWRTGYADIRLDLTSEVFPQHAGFYLWQTLAQCSPVIIGLALVGLRPWTKEKLFHVLWFAAFFLFYCFWRSGGDRWWWTRFLLPGYPAIFLLAAIGFGRLRDHWSAHARPAASRNGRVLVLFAAVALLPLWETYFGWSQHDLWKLNKGHGYYDIVRQVEAVVPPRSLVGSVELAGSFHLYTQLTGFISEDDHASDLIREGFRQQRAVYILVEPWNRTQETITANLALFSSTKIRELPITGWGTLYLYRLRSPISSPASAAGAR